MSNNRVAAVQMASGPNLSANLESAAKLLKKAQRERAALAVLPEYFALMGSEAELLAAREQPGSGPIQDFLAAQARRRGLWICAGAVPLASPSDPGLMRSAYLLYDEQGTLVGRYDKIHLFDVTVPGEQVEQYRESDFIEPGREVVVVDTPFGRLGLAACYDLRFPELFRAMLPDGLDLIAIPSAFTAVTGRAHWETLLRARAIENLCYVVAAAQGGFHISGRETWGDSMIIDPWGSVLERRRKGAGVVVQDVDASRVGSIRRLFPTINHRRMSTGHL